MMKKMIALMIAGTMTLSTAACGATGTSSTAVSTDVTEDAAESISEDGYVGMPNPLTEYDSIEEARAAVGFDFQVPEAIDGYTERTYIVIDTEPQIIEVIYSNGESEMTIRKSVCSENISANAAESVTGETTAESAADYIVDSHDISGVYTDYAEKKFVDINGNTVTLREENEVAYVAFWTDGVHDYSVFADSGVDENSMMELVEQVQ